ncbi:MAG: tRNA (adenosine(37)-N6)-threonylcarbamoyltransferase complex ATPase subunit type 1 TsaE [Patescibacteria group bacterium]
MELTTQSAAETKDLGKTFANKLNGGEILALTGELGSGKTTFVQGLAEGLGIKGRIISPTFILMRKYQIPDTKYQIHFFYHIDLYRLEENLEQEIKNLGVFDILGERGNIAVIEWAEKIKDLIPESATWIKFESLGQNKRKILVK